MHDTCMPAQIRAAGLEGRLDPENPDPLLLQVPHAGSLDRHESQLTPLTPAAGRATELPHRVERPPVLAARGPRRRVGRSAGVRGPHASEGWGGWALSLHIRNTRFLKQSIPRIEGPLRGSRAVR